MSRTIVQKRLGIKPEKEDGGQKPDTYQPLSPSRQPFSALEDEYPADCQQTKANRIEVGEPGPQLFGMIEMKKVGLVEKRPLIRLFLKDIRVDQINGDIVVDHENLQGLSILTIDVL